MNKILLVKKLAQKFQILIFFSFILGYHERGFSDSSIGKKIHLQCRRPWFDSWVGKISWRRDRLPTQVFLGFPMAQLVTSPPTMRETRVRSLGWEDPPYPRPEKGKPTPLQYSGLENSMDCMVHGFTKSRTRLSDFHFTLLEKED